MTTTILGFQCWYIIINLVLEELQTKRSSLFHVVSSRTVWLESPLRDCGATALCDVQCGGATCRSVDCVSACGSSGFAGELDTVQFYQKLLTHSSFRSYGTKTDAFRTSAYLRLCTQSERNSQNTNCNKQKRDREREKKKKKKRKKEKKNRTKQNKGEYLKKHYTENQKARFSPVPHSRGKSGDYWYHVTKRSNSASSATLCVNFLTC